MAPHFQPRTKSAIRFGVAVSKPTTSSIPASFESAIEKFVAVMPTRSAQRAPAAEQLAEILAVRRQLSAEKVAAENASRLLEDAMLQRLSVAA